MKRKKWTEYEESTLITEYSSLLSSGALSKLRSREKKFLPIADRVNALHHLRDPDSFPFLWSWRDVSVKIQNMRHQYLGVKHKILRPSSSPSAAADFDWDDGVNIWPNFLLYKQVFGDLDLDPDLDSDDEDEELGVETEEETRMLAKRVLEQGEAAARRRAREEEEDWASERRRRERETAVEDERRERWRRREERREEEEMEWRERMLVMQMEHEKQVMQMQAEVCQGQMQIAGILARLACQFFGAGAGVGDGGMPSQVLQGLQQEQEQGHSPGSLVGDDGKNGAHSSEHYL